jgi:predicted transcriptional regulator
MPKRERKKLSEMVMLRLDADTHRKLQAIANRRDRAVTYVIRDLLAKALTGDSK